MDITAYQTPFKYSHSVLKPSRVLGAFDQVAVDVPFVFSHNGKVHMMYVGFDGIGYQTALAQADNPLGPFQTLGVILSRGQETVGQPQRRGSMDHQRSGSFWNPEAEKNRREILDVLPFLS